MISRQKHACGNGSTGSPTNSHLPLNPLRMQKLTENYVSSNAKIKMALGIAKFPVDARAGLIETIKCFAKKQ